ncbi:cellulose biosynthesis cyclic di-GMP-binding regulatory protein BcsB, partial [bacterium]|nr:cellulose biosynthesis cyclic di-GMP-binding regulatory protein BcsB [bacterium]
MPRPLLPVLALVALVAGGTSPAATRVAFGAAPAWDQATISWGLQAPTVPPTFSEDGLWVSFAITPGFYLSTGADSLLPLIERVEVDGEAGEVRILRRHKGSSVSAEAEGENWVLRVGPPASHKFWFVDLVDLGYSADISSWGTRDEIDLWFPNPGAAVVLGGSHLLLSYAAKSDLKEGSALTVVMDGEPTATLSLAAGHAKSARISLENLEPEQFLGSTLGITLIPYLYSLPGTCDNLSTADDWFRLDRHSGLRYLLADTGPPTSLAEFFAPGPDAIAVEPARVGDPADTEATLWLVAGIDRLDRVTRSLSIGPPLAGRRHIVVGTAASVAARAGDGESRWDLAAEAAEELANSPEALGIARIFPTSPSLLVVVGRDAAGLREAVRFLLSDSARDSAQGENVLIRSGPDPDPEPAVSSIVTFGDLGFSGFDLRGGSRWTTVMQLNRSSLGSFPTGVEMHFAAVHSPVPEMDRAFLHVIVNDSLLASYSLGEEMQISPAPIAVPDYLLRRSNRIRFELEYSMFVKDCGGALPQMRFRIPPSGFFDVSGHRPPATLTFDDFPEAFHRPLVLRLPADPTLTDLAIAASALRSLQHLPGAWRMLPKVVFGGWGDGGDDAEIWLVPQDSAQEVLGGVAPLTPYPPFTVVGPPPAGELYAYRDGESV